MGFDLVSRNKKLNSFYMGSFSWSWMLDAGVGLVLGAGRGVEPATCIWLPDNKGRSPYYNDGFRVTAAQARAMALAARGLVAVKESINDTWASLDAITADKYKRADVLGLSLYQQPVRDDFIEKAQAFADWAEQSQGFAVW